MEREAIKNAAGEYELPPAGTDVRSNLKEYTIRTYARIEFPKSGMERASSYWFDDDEHRVVTREIIITAPNEAAFERFLDEQEAVIEYVRRYLS